MTEEGESCREFAKTERRFTTTWLRSTDIWPLKLPEQQDPFHFRMHAQRVCIIAAYPVLRLCDAGNIAALSAHGVSNTELPHEFSSPVEILRTMPQASLRASHTHARLHARSLASRNDRLINIFSSSFSGAFFLASWIFTARRLFLVEQEDGVDGLPSYFNYEILFCFF